MKYIKSHNPSKIWLAFLLIPILISSFLITACPNTTDCGAHQIEVNGNCECEEGYQWNENETKCVIDTTSHYFVWEIDTIGFSGTLKDIFIIEDNNMWVVGDIRIDNEIYGAAIWDGDKWDLMKLEANGSNILPRGVWAFSENDIWLASGSIYHWNGNETTLKWLRDITTEETIEKIWAFSSNNIFFVGNKGTIIHYDGNDFNRMESGTEVDLLDIWGVSASDIWVSGKETGGSVILHYNGSEWDKFYEWDTNLDEYTLPTDSILLTISSNWTNLSNDSLVAVGGWGVFHVSKETKRSRWVFERRWDVEESLPGYPLKVRGNAWNNIFVCGTRNTILHYNGRSWHHFIEFYNDWGVWMQSIGLSENKVVIVGGNFIFQSYYIK